MIESVAPTASQFFFLAVKRHFHTFICSDSTQSHHEIVEVFFVCLCIWTLDKNGFDSLFKFAFSKMSIWIFPYRALHIHNSDKSSELERLKIQMELTWVIFIAFERQTIDIGHILVHIAPDITKNEWNKIGQMVRT